MLHHFLGLFIYSDEINSWASVNKLSYGLSHTLTAPTRGFPSHDCALSLYLNIYKNTHNTNLQCVSQKISFNANACGFFPPVLFLESVC